MIRHSREHERNRGNLLPPSGARRLTRQEDGQKDLCRGLSGAAPSHRAHCGVSPETGESAEWGTSVLGPVAQCLQGPSGEGGRLPWPAGGVHHYLG